MMHGAYSVTFKLRWRTWLCTKRQNALSTNSQHLQRPHFFIPSSSVSLQPTAFLSIQISVRTYFVPCFFCFSLHFYFLLSLLQFVYSSLVINTLQLVNYPLKIQRKILTATTHSPFHWSPVRPIYYGLRKTVLNDDFTEYERKVTSFRKGPQSNTD